MYDFLLVLDNWSLGSLLRITENLIMFIIKYPPIEPNTRNKSVMIIRNIMVIDFDF